MKFTICLTILVALLLAVNVHSLPTKESTDSNDSVAHEPASDTNFKDSEAVHSLLLKSMKKIIDRDTRQASAVPPLQPAINLIIKQLEENYNQLAQESTDKKLKTLAERVEKLEKLTTSTGYAVSPSGQHNGEGTVLIELLPLTHETTGGAYPLGQVQPVNSNGNQVVPPNPRATYLYRN